MFFYAFLKFYLYLIRLQKGQNNSTTGLKQIFHRLFRLSSFFCIIVGQPLFILRSKVAWPLWYSLPIIPAVFHTLGLYSPTTACQSRAAVGTILFLHVTCYAVTFWPGGFSLYALSCVTKTTLSLHKFTKRAKTQPP